MLDLYKNIKARRKELKMTQTELAEKVGYKDKSAIARIEKGEIDLPLSKIKDFSRALEISPSDLLGGEYKPKMTFRDSLYDSIARDHEIILGEYTKPSSRQEAIENYPLNELDAKKNLLFNKLSKLDEKEIDLLISLADRL